MVSWIFCSALLILSSWSLTVRCQSEFCRRTQYECLGAASQEDCLPRKKMCNGRPDCPQGEDEDLDVCRTFCGTQGNRVFCEFNHKCQKRDQICEDVCESGKYRCTSGVAPYACVALNDLCDGNMHCTDGDDESIDVCEGFCTNTRGRFFCRVRRKCLPLTNMCDGKQHCPECEDEDHEICQNVICSGKFTRCGGSSQCIKLKHICNNRTECMNGWDEEQTHCPLSYLIGSPLPTPSPVCYDDDTSTNEYESCNEEIEYYDYTAENYHPDVYPVRELFDHRLCEPALFAHNWVRSFHVDMPLMTYEPVLAARSENYSMYLGDRLLHGEFGGHSSSPGGENIFIGFAFPESELQYVFSMEEVTFSWYDEGRECNYDFETRRGDEFCTVGHFLQVISQYYTRVGCGASISVLVGQQYLYVVCQYLTSQSPSEPSPLREGVSFPTNHILYEP